MSLVGLPYYLGDPLPAFTVEGVPAFEVAVAGTSPQERMVSLFTPVADWLAGESRSRDGSAAPLLHAADCMVPLAVIAGLQRAGVEPRLIWLDAHGDFNTWETTPSGYLGGMPVAMLVGRGEQTIVEGLNIRPLPEEAVTLADARDLDPGERTALHGSAVRVMSVAEIAEMPLPEEPVHIHLDVDIVDPGALPGLLYPAPGGPDWNQLLAALRHLAAAPRIAAISVAHTYQHDGPRVDAARGCARLLVAALTAAG
jgi:arginase